MGHDRVAMDSGGTFTDVAAYPGDAGTYAAGKSARTPHDLTEAVVAVLAQVVEDVPEIGFFGHVNDIAIVPELEKAGLRFNVGGDD